MNDTYEAFPATLRERLATLDEATLRFKPAPTEWSIAEIVGHYGDIEAAWIERVSQILATDNPSFAPFAPDATVAAQRHQEQPFDALLDRFATRRSDLLARIGALQAEQLARTGVHPTRGVVTIESVPTMITGHDALHIAQIEANLAAYEQQHERMV